MKPHIARMALVGILLLPCSCVLADGRQWSLEASFGTAYNAPRTLTVKQHGQPDISFDARFETKAFDNPLYYSLRLGSWQNSEAWEFEFIHHKLYVDNTPDEIEHFEITHGFNIMTINKAWAMNNTVLHLGVGTVLAHPDTTVRGLSSGYGAWNEGYHLGGYALQGAIQRRFIFHNRGFLSLELKLLHAHTRVPINNGSAEVVNDSLHFLFGYGRMF
jgi:hypothetical protein